MDKVPIPEAAVAPVLNAGNKGLELWNRFPVARVAMLVLSVYLFGYFQFNLLFVLVVGGALYVAHLQSFESDKEALRQDLLKLNESPKLLRLVMTNSESMTASPSAAAGHPTHLSSDHISTDFREEKVAAKRRALEMALDDELDLVRLRRKLAREIGVPNWIKFNGDRESVHWLNTLLTLLWQPWMKQSIEKAIRESLDPLLAENCPSFLSGIQMGKVDLGCGIDSCRIIDEYVSIADLSGTSGDEDSMAEDDDDNGGQSHDSSDDDSAAADLIDERLMAQASKEDAKKTGRRGSLSNVVGAVGGGVSSGVRSSIQVAKSGTRKVTNTVGKVANTAVGSLNAKKRRDLRRSRRRRRRAKQMAAGGFDSSIMTKRCSLVIESVRAYSLVRAKDKDQVILDLDIMFGKRRDTHISIDVKSTAVTMTATLDNIELSGTLRVTLTDFVDFLPCFSKVKICFLNTPQLTYDLGALKIPLSSIPGFKGWLQNTIDDAIESAMVYPVELEIPLFDDPNAQGSDSNGNDAVGLATPKKNLTEAEKKRLKKLEVRKKAKKGRNGETQQGFLNVKILECRNLAKKDTFSESDPLCSLWIEHMNYQNDDITYFDKESFNLNAGDRGSETSGSESDGGTPKKKKRKSRRSLFRSSNKTSVTEEEAAMFDEDVNKIYSLNPEVSGPESKKHSAAQEAAASINSGLSEQQSLPTLRSDKFSPCSLKENYFFEHPKENPYPQPVSTPIMKERTSIVEDNCNPEWNAANFYFLRVYDHSKAVLSIDVQNAKYAAKNDNLGKVRIPLAKCLPRSLSLMGTPAPSMIDDDGPLTTDSTTDSNGSPGLQAPWFEGWFVLQGVSEEKKKRRLSLSFRKKSKDEIKPCIKLRMQYVPIDYECVPKDGDTLSSSIIGSDFPRSQTISAGTLSRIPNTKNNTDDDDAPQKTLKDSTQSLPRSQTTTSLTTTMTTSSSDQSFVKIPPASEIQLNNDLDEEKQQPQQSEPLKLATSVSDANLFALDGGGNDDGDTAEIDGVIDSVTGGGDDASSASAGSSKSWMGKEDIMMTITVIGARDLIKADRGGSSDPYTTLKMKFADPKELCGSKTIGRQSEVQTQVINQDCNPIWNESFQFRLTEKDKNSSLAEVVLKVRVKDHDKFTKDNRLGAVDVSLTQLLGMAMAGAGKSEAQWFDLENVESGQIQMQVSLSRL